MAFSSELKLLFSKQTYSMDSLPMQGNGLDCNCMR
jgi:hypothetical protein